MIYKTRKITAILLTVLAILNISITTLANDKLAGGGDDGSSSDIVLIKEVEVDLPQDYPKCTFTVAFEKEVIEKTTIKSPKGKVYDTKLSDTSKTMKATVDDAIAGTWVVVIDGSEYYANKMASERSQTVTDNNGQQSVTAENQASNAGQDATQPSNVATGDGSGTIVATSEPSKGFNINDVTGKVTVTVQLDDSERSKIDEDIKIAREISGFSYHWENDNIVVEWTDSAVGSVDVQVVDSSTLQVLGESRVEGTSYKCPVKSIVKEVIIEATPSTQQGIEGAEEKFFVKNDYDPNAYVSFEEMQYTNNPSLPFRATLGNEYTLDYYINNVKVGTSDVLQPGEYELEIPLNEGNNPIAVWVVDRSGNRKSFETSVILDTVVPILSILKEVGGTETANDTVKVEGRVDDYSRITVNNEEFSPDWEGNFAVDVPLELGQNNIQVDAYDDAGNVTSYRATVTRIEKPKFSIPIPVIAAAVLLLGGIIFFVVKKIRDSQYEYEDDDDDDDDDNDDGEYKDDNSDDEEDDNGFSGNDPADNADDISSERRVKENGSGLGNIPRRESGGSRKKNLKPSKFRPHKIKNKRQEIISIAYYALLLIVTIVIFNYVILLGTTSSGSMEPTLRVGNFCVYNALAYTASEPERGDIIMFNFAKDGREVAYVKRVIGIPGDKIQFLDGYVIINGQTVNESAYIPENVETNCERSFEVPENSYFVMGDNRENSYDSRYWENPYVPRKEIRGKFMFSSDFPITIKEYFASL